MNSSQIQVEQLAKAYQSCSTAFVAYLDESYQLPNDDRPGDPFYLLAAYVLPIEHLDSTRADIQEIVGSHYWHSNEAHADPAMSEKIFGLSDYLAGAGSEEALIVAVQEGIEEDDRTGEAARARALTALLRATDSHSDCPVGLSVMESRYTTALRGADQKTARTARAAGAIKRQHQFTQVSPSAEALLWLPDVIAFGMSHNRRSNGATYADAYLSLVEIVAVK